MALKMFSLCGFESEGFTQFNVCAQHAIGTCEFLWPFNDDHVCPPTPQ